MGDRQRGRLKAASVIDCEPRHDSIRTALERLFSAEFQAQLSSVQNPYGNGGASEAVVNTLEKISIYGLLKKTFNDLT